MNKTAQDSAPIGGWITVEHKKFDGYDTDNPIHVDGTNHTYFLPKYKQGRKLAFWKHNLLTTDGRDQIHSQVYVETVAANTEAAGNFIAVTTDTAAAAAADTTLASEITTNGLGRAVATTITHTNDTNVTTLAKTFTATGTHTAVHKSATFDASSSGNMYHEAVFTSDATLVSGDTLTVTWTLTLG